MSLIIDGTTKSDVLTGTSGGDNIIAGAGNDVVTAGDGNDTVNGGDGNDRLDGGNGNDVLRGDAGNDRLYGGDGYDILFGDSGNDWLWGGANDDLLYGSLGNDALFGEDGDDVMSGGTGDDRMDGGAGNDTLHGDEGDDLFFASEGYDHLDGGEGIDTLSCTKINGKTIINLGGLSENGSLVFASGNDSPRVLPVGLSTLSGMENAIGSQFDDEFIGNLSQNRMEGREGNDYLLAVGNGDTLVGGSGSDTFNFSPSISNNPLEEAWVEDFNSAEGDKLDLSGLGIVSSNGLDMFADIDNSLPGETIITITGQGQLFYVGAYVIHVLHPSVGSPGVQLSDFVLV